MRAGERLGAPARSESSESQGSVFAPEPAPEGSGLELLEHIYDILFTHGLNGNFSFVNPAGLRLTGHTRQALMRLSLADLAAPEYREAARRIVRGEFEGKLGQWSFPLEIVARDGRRVALQVTTQLVYHNHQPTGFRGIARDVTGFREAQKNLREAESRFLALAELAGRAVFLCQDNRILHVNRAGEALTGFSRAELLERDFQDLVHPGDRELVRRGLARQGLDKLPVPYDLKLRTKTGEPRPVRFAATVIPYQGRFAVLATAAGTAAGSLGGSPVEATLLPPFSHLEQLFENTPAGIVALDRQGHALQANGEFTRMFGFAPEDLAGHEVESLIAPPDRYDEAVALRRYLASGGKFGVESVRRRKDGSLLNVSMMGIPAQEPDSPAAGYVVYRDITPWKAAEQALAESEAQIRALEERYRSLFDRADYGICRATLDGRILDANPALARMLGYQSPAELANLDLAAALWEDAAERQRLLNQFRAQERLVGETCWRRQDGKLITVRLNAVVSHNPAGAADAMEVIVEDITERRALEEQFRQSQKMEAVGRLAGGVAHDFNNLLTVIKGYGELVFFQTSEGETARAQMEEILNAADRAAALTRQLLTFSRRQVVAPKVLDLNYLVGNMEKWLRRLLGEDIELLTALDPALHCLKADPGQLEQVIMNLAVNARDAMPKGGQLIIETANATLDQSYDASVLPGQYIMLAVTDSGEGMSDEVRSRVFEPFFTTKARGTGLGLSTVYGIIKQSGGYVRVYSEAGKGATFKVYLPRVDEVPDAHQANVPEESAFRGTETVLLVEDEEGVRTVIAQVLERYGYAVLATPHGAEALNICTRHRGPVHLLLADVVLAQASGPEVAARLLAFRPQMRVLYMSGYAEDTIVNHGIVPAGAALLQKPFTPEDLVEKVRAVLDTRSPEK
jgi:PAS domain S-box-containing protein